MWLKLKLILNRLIRGKRPDTESISIDKESVTSENSRFLQNQRQVEEPQTGTTGGPPDPTRERAQWKQIAKLLLKIMVPIITIAGAVGILDPHVVDSALALLRELTQIIIP